MSYLRYHIGERLREIRLVQGMTQRCLAEKLGTSDVNVCQMETRGVSTLARLERVLDALGYELVIQPKVKL